MSDHPNPDAQSEFDLLLEQFLAGQIDEACAARLHAMLGERPGGGRDVLAQLRVDAMLREITREDAEGAGSPARLLQNVPTAPLPIRRSAGARYVRWIAWGLAAAACIAVAVLLIQRRSPGSREGRDIARTGNPSTPAEQTSAAVAVLGRAVDVVWANPAESHDVGAPLEPGQLRLKSGLVQIEFFSGARVVLQGPAELKLISPMEAYCPTGRLTAEVPPPARGFKIGTPRGDVIDLGTSFGLNVDGAEAAIHVFKGQIELHSAATGGAKPRGVSEGHGVTLDGGGNVRDITADARAFPNTAALERRALEARQVRFAAWRTAAAKLSADPSLLVRYDFADIDATNDHTILNSSTASTNDGKAVVVGCGRAEGRWAVKPALEFRGVADRVRLNVPGEMESITLAGWVWVNGLDRQYNSLFMTDAFNAGAIHWQILRDGHVRLGVSGAGDYDSPIIFTPERYGRWAHLAVVYDRTTRQVTHYLNGRPISGEAMRNDIKPKIGGAELGNWNPAPRKDRNPVRHFSGRLDEFELFARALPEAEIVDLYSSGNPQADAK